MPRSTDKEREVFRAAHPDWHIEAESISRTFKFGDFKAAMGFVTQVGLAAEVADHHPDIDIRWNKVTLTLSTHEESALTAKDTTLAAEIDGFV